MHGDTDAILNGLDMELGTETLLTLKPFELDIRLRWDEPSSCGTAVSMKLSLLPMWGENQGSAYFKRYK